jgi:hypothetical protein
LSMEPIAGRARLIAKVQLPVALLQFGDKTAHTLGVRTDLADVSDLALSPILGDRHRMARLGHVQPDENFAILLHGSSSCAEDRPAHRGQPSFTHSVGRATLPTGRTCGLTVHIV